MTPPPHIKEFVSVLESIKVENSLALLAKFTPEDIIQEHGEKIEALIKISEAWLENITTVAEAYAMGRSVGQEVFRCATARGLETESMLIEFKLFGEKADGEIDPVMHAFMRSVGEALDEMVEAGKWERVVW